MWMSGLFARYAPSTNIANGVFREPNEFTASMIGCAGFTGSRKITMPMIIAQIHGLAAIFLIVTLFLSPDIRITP